MNTLFLVIPWLPLILFLLCASGSFICIVLGNVYRHWKGNRYASAAWCWAGFALVFLVACPISNFFAYSDDEAMIKAAGDGKLAQVKSLITKGADVNSVDDEYETALAAAIAHKHKDVIVYLLAHGANPNLQGKDIDGNMSTPRHAARNQSDIVQLLRGAGVQP